MDFDFILIHCIMRCKLKYFYIFMKFIYFCLNHRFGSLVFSVSEQILMITLRTLRKKYFWYFNIYWKLVEKRNSCASKSSILYWYISSVSLIFKNVPGGESCLLQLPEPCSVIALPWWLLPSTSQVWVKCVWLRKGKMLTKLCSIWKS